MDFFGVTYNEVQNIITKQGLPRKLHQRESAKSVARKNFVGELIDFIQVLTASGSELFSSETCLHTAAFILS